eukprot:scaffold5127_cov191-Skeletonema_dohrnii-CCMP3373.AAC.2
MDKDAVELVHQQDQADGMIMTEEEAGELIESKVSPGHRQSWEGEKTHADPLPLPTKACDFETWSNAATMRRWLHDTWLH